MEDVKEETGSDESNFECDQRKGEGERGECLLTASRRAVWGVGMGFINARVAWLAVGERGERGCDKVQGMTAGQGGKVG